MKLKTTNALVSSFLFIGILINGYFLKLLEEEDPCWTFHLFIEDTRHKLRNQERYHNHWLIKTECLLAAEAMKELLESGKFTECAKSGNLSDELIQRYKTIRGYCDDLPHVSNVGPVFGKYGIDADEMNQTTTNRDAELVPSSLWRLLYFGFVPISLLLFY